MPEALGSQVLGMSHKTHRAGCPRARPPLGSSSQQRWGREPRCQIPKEDATFRIPLAPGARALCTSPTRSSPVAGSPRRRHCAPFSGGS